MHASRKRLDASRWHWQHGPIDIVAQACGVPAAVFAAHEAAWKRFEQILPELVAELAVLRAPIPHRLETLAGSHAWAGSNPLVGPVARRMWDACAPFARGFITPMAAVAGSVAEELIGFYERPGIERAWLNNGGDIAFHLAPGTRISSGIVSRPDDYLFGDASADRPGAGGRLDASFLVRASDPARGVATSGWRGRSLSMGIADSVTVIARTAAQADAAATMVANAVDIDHPGVLRKPANTCRDDSDLGDRLVTIDVAPLPGGLVEAALRSGATRARELQQRGLLWAAFMVCQEQVLRIDPLCSPESRRYEGLRNHGEQHDRGAIAA